MQEDAPDDLIQTTKRVSDFTSKLDTPIESKVFALVANAAHLLKTQYHDPEQRKVEAAKLAVFLMREARRETQSVA